MQRIFKMGFSNPVITIILVFSIWFAWTNYINAQSLDPSVSQKIDDTSVDLSLPSPKTLSDVVVDQSEYFSKNNTYYSDTTNDNLQVYTYETLCTGYYIVEKKDGIIKQTAFGDLSEKFTKQYVIEKTVSTSTVSVPSVD